MWISYRRISKFALLFKIYRKNKHNGFHDLLPSDYNNLPRVSNEYSSHSWISYQEALNLNSFCPIKVLGKSFRGRMGPLLTTKSLLVLFTDSVKGSRLLIFRALSHLTHELVQMTSAWLLSRLTSMTHNCQYQPYKYLLMFWPFSKYILEQYPVPLNEKQ